MIIPEIGAEKLLNFKASFGERNCMSSETVYGINVSRLVDAAFNARYCYCRKDAVSLSLKSPNEAVALS